MDSEVALIACAMLLAAVAGGIAGVVGSKKYREFQLRRRVHSEVVLDDVPISLVGEELNDYVIRYMTGISRRLSLGAERSFAPGIFVNWVDKWFQVHGRKAGLASSAATAAGLAESSLKLGLTLAFGGMVFGACFSPSFAVVGLMCGGACGMAAPFRAVLLRQRMRSALLGQELSEMLEVIALALRSGLSFDRGFQLYCQHFRTPFAQSCEAARRTWVYGLDSRENALKELAASYDSSQLDRAVQGIVRSIRFGSSLADVLEQTAADARQSHRAHVQERVAKAPVKMMIPTGVLILPAMLLLVMGPVLLELTSGV